jgi:hypothetical protein
MDLPNSVIFEDNHEFPAQKPGNDDGSIIVHQ